MGIQGLLPLLKPIQRHRPLSDFSGQTLAVDAYVWLHRGAYSCATELVQGRPTRRYVDFCMARVRLLRHHGISPYLVFDGGPLPAKLGTEKEREKKREQNIKRANELMAQGKESQARELYVKCVDVTPQMAYQVIKALKAENVPYVVAPYEADAQLAYLERMGLVDGIITEDSDLLVFGCRNVHVKLDTVSASVVSISRTDFGSSSLAADSFSLIGWSDAQFRWMAMLSGCDYLPSIAGIGLKTAYQLLKKYKTVEKAVRMIRLDGKKSVPKDYVDAFFLAEKVFLHQRVYDPCLKKLVYLTSPSNEFCLSEEVEMYIGRDLEPSLATRIAEGDTCPISLNVMDDINPSFVPRPVKALPLQRRDVNSSKTPKGKEPTKKTSILNFFTPVSNSSPEKRKGHKSEVTPTPTKKKHSRINAGNASGKRTLVEVMEHDIATKRKRISAEAEEYAHHVIPSTSRFFNDAGPSGLPSGGRLSEKENISPIKREEVETIEDPVTQEDGYLSPSPSLARDITPDLSSPVMPYGRARRRGLGTNHNSLSQDTPTQGNAVEHIFVKGSSEPPPDCDKRLVPGPDLTANLVETDEEDLEADRKSEPSSEILCWEEDEYVDQQKEVFEPSPVRPATPPLSAQHAQNALSTRSTVTRTASFDDPTDELELLEIDEDTAWEREQSALHTRLAHKWKLTYSFGSRLINAGSAPSSNADPRSSPKEPPREKQSDISKSLRTHDTATKHEKQSDAQLTTTHAITRSRVSRENLPVVLNCGLIKLGTHGAPISIDGDDASDEIVCSSRNRLQAFSVKRFELRGITSIIVDASRTQSQSESGLARRERRGY